MEITITAKWYPQKSFRAFLTGLKNILTNNKKFPEENLKLKNIHLVFNEGETILIIGTSGAGKSTLIKCIVGATSYVGNCTGYKVSDIAYIPQHPALNKRLSVYNTIHYSQMFSMADMKKNHIESDKTPLDYIKKVGLFSVRFKPCGKLSGGQMQRVSIAKELIRNKKIIIADEIDTGLDCGVAKDIVEKLCDITHDQKLTTIVISHNLINVELYDKIVVLVKNSNGIGQIAYFGEPKNAKSFFEVAEYVDILKKVNSVDEGGEGNADQFISKFAAQNN